MSNTKIHLRSLALGLAVAAFSREMVQAQTSVVLDPAWRVTGVDTSKPGFIWNYFQAGVNTGNNTARTESDLAGLSRDATGALFPNLGNPDSVGAAITNAAPANPANGLLHFEITNVINLSKTDAGASGYFPDDQLEPGINLDISTDGQSAEILTYLDLAAGTNTMGVRSDDGFKCESGPNPQDIFGRSIVAERSGGAGELVFAFVVQQAGIYPFRTIWENGGGDSHIEWYSVQADSTKVLVNDVANGGIPAYRALSGTAVAPPFIKTVVPAPVPRQAESAYPDVRVVLADGSTAVDTNSIALKIDGAPATITKERLGNQVTVDTGVLAGLHVPGEAHTAVLTFKDVPGTYSRTQQWAFYNLENLILPATPITGENFDSYPESTGPENTVPPGWVATNFTFHETAGWDLTDITSDAFLDMVIISTNTVFPLEDEVLDNYKGQLINGQPVTDWMSGNLLFSASDGRLRTDPITGSRVGQIRYVISAPFNLSTVTNPVLTFSSGVRITGNRSEQMSVEYSIDKGTNWLPAIYMQNAATLKFNSDGTYDALAMFNTLVTNDIPLWPTPGVGPFGGKFGDIIAAPISQALAPYIANRNDTALSRKVEAIRLPQASRQNDVRLRLAHIGACGWEWGVDNIAFYDLPSTSVAPHIDRITPSNGQITIQWSGGGTLESSPTLDNPAWASTGNNSGSFSESLPRTGNKFYRVQQ